MKTINLNSLEDLIMAKVEIESYNKNKNPDYKTMSLEGFINSLHLGDNIYCYSKNESTDHSCVPYSIIDTDDNKYLFYAIDTEDQSEFLKFVKGMYDEDTTQIYDLQYVNLSKILDKGMPSRYVLRGNEIYKVVE